MIEMKRTRLPLFALLAMLPVFLISCGAVNHTNEKLITGKWIPVKAEIVVDSSALQAAAALTSGKQAGKGRQEAGNEGNNDKRKANLDRLVQMEMRATMEIYPNYTAVKNFPGKPLNATWKMKRKGSRIVGKNLENKQKFTIDILELSKEQIVVIEHAPVGDIKITYTREQ